MKRAHEDRQPVLRGEEASARELGGLHVGWHELLPDVSLNFQLNRWAAYGGPRWLEDVRPMLARMGDYEGWRNTFVELGERAFSDGRTLHAALHFRAAEFFMSVGDPRKDSLRRRLLPMLREAAGIPVTARHEVRFDALRLPVWHLPSQHARGTIVVFGGFDSYVEELFPLLMRLHETGFGVVAFEGPGQGSVLEEQHAPLILDWHRPVAAVLDALELEDVTLVGISLGGCLAIRAAAFEPRVRRVVAFDVLVDFWACMLKQQPAAVAALVQGAMTMGAGPVLNALIKRRARSSPVVEWGVARAMQVFGCERPYDAFRVARALHTRDVSPHVQQDVLLLAGSCDHYVPAEQIWDQARRLRRARSVTARVFTVEEHAQAHCQIGNLPLALGTIGSWIDSMAIPTRT